MFNEKQLEAINSLEGRVRVIAGAGSGKTKTLVERYIRLLDKGIKPENILCVTFTNKAANEMKERINKIKENDLSLITTFHSFCLRIIRENSYLLGWSSNFAVLDSEDQTSILKSVYKECGIDYEEVSYKVAKDIIANFKINKELFLLNVFKPDLTIKKLYEEYRDKYKNGIFNKDGLKNAIYFGYLYHQQKSFGIDFNDMIILACLILKQNKSVLNEWRDRLQYIMVDEFQDVSQRQYELVSMLSDKHGNLFVVGDPDQTIYSWRGAKPELLVNFDKEKPTKTIIMNQNYRSTPQILKVANDIIEKNELRVEKDLFTENKSGDKVFFAHLDNNKAEGEWIANKIQDLLKKYKPEDICVLYRMHFISRAIEENLIKKRIPYIIHSGTNFYERKEIKDILSYLRVISNPDDDIALKRIINVPTRGIGKKKIEELEKYCSIHDCSIWQACNYFITNEKGKLQDFVLLINYLRNQSELCDLYKLVKLVIEKSGYKELLDKSLEEDRKENIEELKKSILELDNKFTLDEYLQEIALLTNTDKKNRKAVTLMTIHSAKGLEFPVVFVAGMNEGQFPCSYSNESKETIEEERRLAYVAYTRAKEKLFLTDCSGKDFQGEDKETSRYIEEILEDLDTYKQKRTFDFFKPKCFSSNRYQHRNNYYNRENKNSGYASVPRCHGQYFDKQGNYYDWDDDTYLQGSITAQDIFDEGDFC